jgi:hypothetical protein
VACSDEGQWVDAPQTVLSCEGLHDPAIREIVNNEIGPEICAGYQLLYGNDVKCEAGRVRLFCESL